MAGRREKPIRADVAPVVRTFAERLRELRDASGLTCREVADRSGVSAATVSRAASGAVVPGAGVLLVVAGALALQEKERTELERLRCAAERERVTTPEQIPQGVAALHRRLVQLHEAAGRPSLRTLENLSGIPRSTVHRCLTDPRGSQDRKRQITQVLARLVEPADRGTQA